MTLTIPPTYSTSRASATGCRRSWVRVAPGPPCFSRCVPHSQLLGRRSHCLFGRSLWPGGWLRLRDAAGSLGRNRVTIRVGCDPGSAARGGIGRSGTVERSTTARSVDHVVTAAGSRCERRGSESLDPCPGAVGTALARAHPRYRASLALSVPEPVLVLNEPGTPDESGAAPCVRRFAGAFNAGYARGLSETPPASPAGYSTATTGLAVQSGAKLHEEDAP